MPNCFLSLLAFVFAFSASAQDYTKLKIELEEMNRTDQQYRIILDSLMRKEKLQWEHPSIQQLIPKALQQDSINQAALLRILDQYGWLGTGQVGKLANETQFLIIQHADSSILARYFPLLVQSYEIGQTPAKYYALMLDRILTDKNQKQVFGTQVQMDKQSGRFTPFPIADEKNVDTRRKRAGLPTLAKQMQSYQ
ncbi:MAG TPA: DUF6624 domain-containing protein [Flavisolibacter sp.]|nr:DUF6624 domain-containing protein [Flavisolibacter sp.]